MASAIAKAVPHENLSIYQGDDWSSSVQVSNPDGTPADLTGYSAKSQIRTDVADNASTVAAEILTVISNATGGEISMSLSNTVTKTLSGGRYKWDIQITSPLGIVTTILTGDAIVASEITRI